MKYCREQAEPDKMKLINNNRGDERASLIVKKGLGFVPLLI